MIFETFIIAFLMVVAIVLILLEIFMLPGITVAGVGGFLLLPVADLCLLGRYAGGKCDIGGIIARIRSLLRLVVAFQILQPGGFENRHRFQAGVQP